METSKKLTISITAVAVLALVAIVSLVVVLAAFNVTATSNFRITYTAEGVEATVTAQYRTASNTDGIGNYTIIQSSDNKNSITFDRQASGSATTQSFKAINNVTISKTQFFVVNYIITNTSSTTDFEIELTLPGSPNNFARSYFCLVDSNVDPTAKAFANISGGTESFTPITLQHGKTAYVYVMFSIVNTDTDANFTGTSTWTLSKE
ncbi:MAG: hypothetical protein IKC79_00945 [Clostridia bacterium]|nr:hypothetical protein [Clostridia bacterium]